LWATPHGLDLSALAAAYGVPVSEASTLDELRDAVAVGGRGVRMVLARTSRADNVAVHATLHRAIAGAVGSL
jgi:2-succinyl-5-enolpyruvyl-6-hydroxy-3-cyclohexene-1-carboxylate synthase